MKKETYDHFCWECKMPWTDNDSMSECYDCGEIHYSEYSNEYYEEYDKKIKDKSGDNK